MQNSKEEEEEQSQTPNTGLFGMSNIPEEKNDGPKKQMKDILPEFKELDECSEQKKKEVTEN